MFEVWSEVIDDDIVFYLEGFELKAKGKDGEEVYQNFANALKDYANTYMDNIEFWNQEEDWYDRFKIMLKAITMSIPEIISEITFI